MSLLDHRGFGLRLTGIWCSRPLSGELQEERWVKLSIAPLLVFWGCDGACDWRLFGVEKRAVRVVSVGALSDASRAGSFDDSNGPNSSKIDNIGRIGIDMDCQIW